MKLPSFTRQDFQYIAKIIQSLNYEISVANDLVFITEEDLVDAFTEALGKTNDNFNKEKFITACMEESNEKNVA